MERVGRKSITAEGGARVAHNQRWVADCPLCGIGFAIKTEFKKHVSTHPRCDKCGRRFTSNATLVHHRGGCEGAGTLER